jgi:uncharacterized membrane protein YhiD involved in acid resistance
MTNKFQFCEIHITINKKEATVEQIENILLQSKFSVIKQITVEQHDETDSRRIKINLRTIAKYSSAKLIDELNLVQGVTEVSVKA